MDPPEVMRRHPGLAANPSTRMRAIYPGRYLLFFLVICLPTCLGSSPVSAAEPRFTEFNAFLYSWKNSWQGRNIDHYHSHYSETFVDGPLSREQWLKKKRLLFTSQPPALLTLSGLCIRQTGNRTATVTFRQHYRAGAREDYGMKEMLLHKENTGWKIVRESWRAVPTLPGDAAADVAAIHGLVKKITIDKAASSGPQLLRFSLSRFAAPTISAHPETNQVVLQFTQAGAWPGRMDVLTGGGGVIKDINVFSVDDCGTVVSVLSLAKSRNGYSAEQFYYKKEKIYELRIKPLTQTSQPRL